VDEARQGLPEELELIPPGPQLAAVLATIDREALSGKDLVRLLQARNRLAAHVQGELYADLNAVRRAEPTQEAGVVPIEDPEEPYPWAAAEIAFALRWTHTAASIRLDQAERMVQDLPMVQQALSAGLIDVPKALVLSDEAALLEPEQARRIVGRLIAKARELTTGQLRAKLRRLVIATDPHAAANRAKAQANGRRVTISQDHHHVASIAGYDLLPHRVAAGYERLTAIAKAAKAAGDSRKMDELRADALLDLLIGEGIAVGEPVTHGGQDQPNQDQPNQDQPNQDRAPSTAHTAPEAPAPGVVTEPGDWDAPWPAAPADADLLDPAADPPHGPAATTPAEQDPPTPAEPPADPGDQGNQAVDPDHERLRPFWLAGFDQLPTTRPARPAGPMPAPRRGVIDLQMSLTTLMSLDDLPAELAGFGPLLADIARQTAQQRPDLQLRFSVYDKLDHLIAHGITKERPRYGTGPPGNRRTRRRPTAEVAALVRARNRTCAAPGCRVPSLRCELDQILAWAAHGESEPDNLDPACRRHHAFKHSPGADLVAFSPGTYGWQTPLGMQYLSRPDPPLYDDHRYIHPPLPGDP
jgi:hypothetical protein